MNSCFIDGNCLCVVGDNFINLQESNAVFIELTPKQNEEIKNLIDEKYCNCGNKLTEAEEESGFCEDCR